MSNMSYCRFQNTSQDLRDCACNLLDDDTGEVAVLPSDEHHARASLLRTCAELLEAVGMDIDMHQLDKLVNALPAPR